jgi:hypothetical protein
MREVRLGARVPNGLPKVFVLPWRPDPGVAADRRRPIRRRVGTDVQEHHGVGGLGCVPGDAPATPEGSAISQRSEETEQLDGRLRSADASPGGRGAVAARRGDRRGQALARFQDMGREHGTSRVRAEHIGRAEARQPQQPGARRRALPAPSRPSRVAHAAMRWISNRTAESTPRAIGSATAMSA